MATTYRATLQPESYIEYRASDPNDIWQGRAPLETLELIFDSEALNSLTLKATLDPGKFDSGNFIRDANARRGVFETGEYPTVTLRAQGLQSDAQNNTVSLAAGETKQVKLRGSLELHGVTREVSVPAEVSREGDTLRATGEFSVLLSDYNMDRPSFLGATVNDEVKVRFNLVSTLSEP